jgi:hypothetical protein
MSSCRGTDQWALTGLEDVVLLAVMDLPAGPALRGRLGELQAEHMPSLNLEAMGADVIRPD